MPDSMDHPIDVNNIVVLNNTTLGDEAVHKQYSFSDLEHPPLTMSLFEKYGNAPENIWRNFLHIAEQQPYQLTLTKEQLQGHDWFTEKLLSFASDFVYMDLCLITSKDICMLVLDKQPQNEQHIRDLLEAEITFKERCSKYIFHKIEYREVNHDQYDHDKYQEIVNIYNEIQ